VNPDFANLVRGIIFSVAGIVAGVWVLLAFRARRMEGVPVRKWTVRAFALFFVVLAVASFLSLEARHDQPLGPTSWITAPVIALMVFMTVAFARDARRPMPTPATMRDQDQERRTSGWVIGILLAGAFLAAIILALTLSSRHIIRELRQESRLHADRTEEILDILRENNAALKERLALAQERNAAHDASLKERIDSLSEALRRRDIPVPEAARPGGDGGGGSSPPPDGGGGGGGNGGGGGGGGGPPPPPPCTETGSSGNCYEGKGDPPGLGKPKEVP
jgi:uncharacterized membrane protein YgcG